MRHILSHYIGIPIVIFFALLILLIFLSTKIAVAFFLIYPALVIVWWVTAFSRWLYKRHSLETIPYLLSNLFWGLGIIAVGIGVGVVVENVLGVWLIFVCLLLGIAWFARSMYELLFRSGGKYKTIHWLPLEKFSFQFPLLGKASLNLGAPLQTTNLNNLSLKQPMNKKKTPNSVFRSVSLPEIKNERKSVPIPPREAKQTNLAVDTWLSLSVPKSRFIEQAKKYANTTEKSAKPMSFMQYWPTYEAMNNAQKKWYFYWRSQIRKGTYLPVDLSYLFLHIYEIIHLIGVDSTKDAFKYLANLWMRYRAQHPKLDGYLIDWIADFIVVYKLRQSPMDWYVQAIKWGGTLTDANIGIEAWLSNGKENFSQIPSNLIDLISDYKYTKSKFYQQGNLQGVIDSQLRQALVVIDTDIRQQHGKSLFEFYRPKSTQVIKRQPFAGAVYEGNRELILIGNIPEWSASEELRQTITSILKYTENRLRRQQNYKGLLSGINLSSGWIDLLDKAYPVIAEADSVHLNTSKKFSRNYVSPEESFVAQATRFADRTEVETKPIAFEAMSPGYEFMNEAQKQWYFYWRSQVRSGNYLAVDRSYFFMYVQEVLNLIGFKTTQAAYEHLKALWHNYHSVFQLDGYFVNWTADFLAFHHLDDKPFDWYAYVLEQGGRPSDKETAVEAWFSQSKSLSEIPIQLLRILSAYDPVKSNFYKQYNSDRTIDKAYGQALEAIDTFLKNSTQKGLVETYRPANYYQVKHWPFGSALVVGRKSEIIIGKVYQWSEATEFHALLGSVIKHTENILRNRYNARGLLRGIDLPSEWIKVLEQNFALSEKTAPEALVIDFAKVQALTEESDAVRERLIVEGDAEIVTKPSAVVDTSLDIIPDITGLNTSRPFDTPAHLLTELDEVVEVVKGSDKVTSLLRCLIENNWEASEDEAKSALNGEFLSVIIDKLNERAIELLGDQLIFIENKRLVVTEDYRDEVEHLFKQPSGTIKVEKELPEAQFDELQPEWANFASSLHTQHWEALNALVVGKDVSSRLDGIARSVHSTMGLLIDEINEFALLTIGDIVIEAGSPPLIEEEDLPDMRSLMVWALKNIIEV